MRPLYVFMREFTPAFPALSAATHRIIRDALLPPCRASVSQLSHRIAFDHGDIDTREKIKARHIPGFYLKYLFWRAAFISFLRPPFLQRLLCFFLGGLILSSTHKHLAYF